MKSLLIASALVFATSSASASVTATLLRAKQAIEAAAAASKTQVSPTVMARLGAAAPLMNGEKSAEVEKIAQRVIDGATAVSTDNTDSGIPKAKRLEALALDLIVSMENEASATPNQDLRGVLTGQLFTTAINPRMTGIGEAQFDKFIGMMKLIVDEKKAPEDASRTATGGTLAAFVAACGPKAVGPRQ